MPDEAKRQKPSAHGAVLGTALAKLADSQVAAHPNIPERCATCAFRAGTVPNQMAGTLMEALNCVVGIDQALFCCHHKLRPGQKPTTLCSGYMLSVKAPFRAVREMLEEVMPQLAAISQAKGNQP